MIDHLLQVRASVNKEIAQLVAWSLRWAGLGRYPACGYYGEEFPNNSYRKSLRGRPIAGGYKSLDTQCFVALSNLTLLIVNVFVETERQHFAFFKDQFPLKGWSIWLSKQTSKLECSVTA